MKDFLRSFFSQWYKYLLWALMSVFVWGWIFGLHADAIPAKKLVLDVDRPAVQADALAEALSEGLPAGIRLVAVHSFDYYIFSTDELLHADLYIVGENRAADYIESFVPLAETGLDTEGAEVWSLDGTAYGLRIYDAARGEGLAEDYIAYAGEGEAPQDYYLFFGSQSAHREDGAALWLAKQLQRLP